LDKEISCLIEEDEDYIKREGLNQNALQAGYQKDIE
jgi:hypothetical protein